MQAIDAKMPKLTIRRAKKPAPAPVPVPAAPGGAPEPESGAFDAKAIIQAHIAEKEDVEPAPTQGAEVLAHLGTYTEEPYAIIGSYFRNRYLERIVRHQIESYNYFIGHQIQNTIQMFNPVLIRSENDYVAQYDKYLIEILVSFENFRMFPPQIHENNGATKLMLPQEAKLRNFTYASAMTVDIQVQYVVRNSETMDNKTIYTKTLERINIGNMPIMLKSDICVLTQNRFVDPVRTGECPMDMGGYFIIKGSEKTVLAQERAAENRVYCFNGKGSAKWSWTAEIKSVPDYKCISPKQVDLMVSSKSSGFGNSIFVTIPRVKNPIELFVLFRALGVISDKAIVQHILLDIADDRSAQMLAFLRASAIESARILTREDALRHIVSSAAYTPINMDRETGARKKLEFVQDLLANDLFPHCRTAAQKRFFLGYMAHKVISAALGWIPADDRDSYLNKRVELTGTLMNNLFRNYFNKFVKEMQKQVVRELNTGSWRSMDDYDNIINMTNIYKLLKPATIENGINRALSTGDFSIKQSNSSKVGVAQVLNRLTYAATISHLRRVNTPLEKSGELIPPRKLHNTTWGFLCPVETPEGASIGIVKNIAYLAHVTIPTSSVALHEYIMPHISALDDASVPATLFDRVKVFVNGAWIGVSDSPQALYADLKAKKTSGVINVYTSVVFDYARMEIRVCNDGGRLARPVLRVRDNRALISRDMIARLDSGDLDWNDLLTGCALPDAAIEYIDPEEQNLAVIAMKTKDGYVLPPNSRIQFSHCEIHPSTIFGMLASCIPFPEHNQSPRNVYQCAMMKQALGTYALNHDQRMDKTAYILTAPTRPLVSTRVAGFLRLDRVPAGQQIHVAIMAHTGYNMEDSVLLNKGAVDRGLFAATIFHTERDEDKNIIRDEIVRCKPDPAKTKGIKFGNYDKLDANGFIPEDTQVNNRDVIIAKIVPIKENRNDPSKVIKYEDQSKTFRTTEETYIDKNYTGRNGDGYNFAKVRTRTFRKPCIGDKFACALPTQEVLTHLGWVQMVDLDPELHRVCTLDAAGNMCYEHPTQKFVYDYEGPMYSVENKQARIVCTPNHKLYVRRRAQPGVEKPFELMEAQHAMGRPLQFQKSLTNVYPDVPTIRLGEKEYDMDAWLRLLGMFIGDGCTNSGAVYIAGIKPRKVAYNTETLSVLGVAYRIDPAHGVSFNKGPYREMYEALKALSVGALNKRLPDYVWDLSQRQSAILMDALMNSDGCTMTSPLGKTDFCRYYTISPGLADDVMRLATHCGWSGLITVKSEPDETVGHTATATLGPNAGTTTVIYQRHTYYMISIIKKQNQPWINKKVNPTNIEQLVDYAGKVYCVEMPSSHLYYFRENKFAPSMVCGNSAAAQKGTAGLIIPECDMPFTKDGLRPDLILNPHAIPSRMTIAQLKETILGKVLVELGLAGDGTAFGELDMHTIVEQLGALGYESYGNEIMYNGLTGEQMEVSVFLGPVYYQRLKHMVNDKQHSRSIGPMVNLTRQPAEGRSRDGGFRVGEMERDVIIAHGISAFCRERFYTASDKYRTYVCNRCGLTPVYNDGTIQHIQARNEMTIHKCLTCENTTDFSLVEIPYSFKLLAQELQTINVVPRIITDSM